MVLIPLVRKDVTNFAMPLLIFRSGARIRRPGLMFRWRWTGLMPQTSTWGHSVVRIIELLVVTFAVIVALSLWFTLGFIVWIGLVIRVSCGYAVSACGAAFTGQSNPGMDRVVKVARIWIDGLQDIVALYERTLPDKRAPFIASQWKDIWREILASLIVLIIYSSAFLTINLLL